LKPIKELPEKKIEFKLRLELRKLKNSKRPEFNNNLKSKRDWNNRQKLKRPNSKQL
jgi:hypothetical protein